MQITKHFFITCALVIGIITIPSVIKAVTIQPPMPYDRGPMRYLFDFDEPESTRNLKLWTGAFMRYSGAAYTDVLGSQTENLSRLIFNKTDFRVTEAFPDCLVPQNAEFYNPLMRTAHFENKIDYKENTFLFGGRYTIPVNNNEGRVGVRWVVPLRRATIRRLDARSVPRGASLEDVLAYSSQVIPRTGEAPINVTTVPMMRMDFAEALVQSRSKNPALIIDSRNKPRVGGSEISDANLAGGDDAFKSSVQRCLCVVRSPRNFIPRPPVVKNTAVITSVPVITAPATAPTVAQMKVADGTDDVLPDDGNAEYRMIYRLETVGDPGKYGKLADETTTDIDERLARQELKEELWLIPRVSATDSTVSGFGVGGTLKTLVDLSEQVTENVYEWLEDRGYSFETTTVAGFGNASVDVFYEHAIADKCYGELFVGLVLPTAQESDDFLSAYHTYLGNGKHFEVKCGAALFGQPLSRLNIKIDGLYACVIPREETMRASFRGSNIKNMGPLVKGFVGWNYLVGKVEATIFHFKSRALSTMFGYEIYYKQRDSLSFPSNTMETWQGKQIQSDGQMISNPRILDESVTTKNTDSIAHRVKIEASMRITNQCEFALGFAYTISGKNTPQTVDLGMTFNVIF
ncbi:hypothetical protein FJ366_00985 [Candidatus Dependentiae bacterium]|nr:hypothetical protein [Candidatus Dependentiae bacterium]